MNTPTVQTACHEIVNPVPPSVPAPSGYRDGERRERDLGVGYGKSSGYARKHRYAARSDRTLFRCG